MFNKLLSFLIIVFLVLNCGSSKQIVNAPKEDLKEIINVSLEVEEVEEVEDETEIELIQDDMAEVEKETIETKTNQNIFNHNTWNALLQKHVSDQGNVDYNGFKADKTVFNAYIKSLSENPPQNSWTKNETLAYWINAYNAFTIDLILRNYPLQSIKDIKEPWDQRLWKIESKWYNLNDIEHQILRKMDEPRIHFAIVCASISCPKLQNTAFTSNDLETQLSNATTEFLNDTSKNNISEHSIKLSKIFKWFAKDFKTNGSLIDFLNQYSEVNISNKAKKSFNDYNWDLND